VKLDLSKLNPGYYQEYIEIFSNGGYYKLPVRVDLVENRTIIRITIDNPRVLVNENEFILAGAPFIRRGLVYLPLRVIFESLGAKVSSGYIAEGNDSTLGIVSFNTRTEN